VISIKQDRYVAQSANRNNRSIYSVSVDNTAVYRGTLKQCKAKVRDIIALHPYTDCGLSQMQGFNKYFQEKYR